MEWPSVSSEEVLNCLRARLLDVQTILVGNVILYGNRI